MTLSNKHPFIAGNWKMYKTLPEAKAFAREISVLRKDIEGATLVVIPPYPAVAPMAELLKDSQIGLGAQNVYWEEQGAYTGEISPPMLKAAGCRYVVIGHSERRQYFGETDETVNKKIKSVLKHDLTPIFCFGESLQEREKGKTIQRIGSQIENGLLGLTPEQVELIVFAYEPIWAIGTGLTATPQQAQEVHAFIRDKLSQRYGNKTGSYAIILYGGSVKPANTFSLLKEKDINGALVGGASLKSDSFIEIAKEALKAYGEK